MAMSWWRHQMDTFLRVTGHLCGEFTGPGEFPAQRPVTRSFEVFFHLRPNKRLSKQSWGWWFETPSHPLWRHCNIFVRSNCPSASKVILTDHMAKSTVIKPQQSAKRLRNSWDVLYFIKCFNTLRPRQIGRHFADDSFRSIFVNEECWFT